MAVALAQHIPQAAMDLLLPLFHDIFPDLKDCEVGCYHENNITCILNMALCPHFQKTLLLQMRENSFALAIHRSHDNGL